MLTNRQVVDICQLGQGKSQCKYLSKDEDEKWVCCKLHPFLKRQAEDKLVNIKKFVGRPSTAIPAGDNCQGYLMLKYIQQGYDVKS